MKSFKLTVFIITIVALFSSCITTGGDISIAGHGSSQSEANLARVETAIVPLEAAGNDARGRQSEITAARRMITELEATAVADADYSGKLVAWSGRLAILEGKYSDAQRLYRQSNSTSPGNIPAVILSIRLEGDPAKRMEMIERELAIVGQRSSGVGELNIERGRALMDLARFSEAAGSFDVAFTAGLNNIYAEHYRATRDRAWDLRNTTGVSAGTLTMLGRESITWNDCIALAKNETQLLRFISGGRNLSDADLFTRLIDRGFIPFTQDITLTEWPLARPRADETVTRAGAALFIWRLYAEARGDRSLLSRYSARYATGANPRSPIADIPPLSPFFDSILGCVETEMLSLPDGRNFRPDQPIRGTELLTILRRIDNN
ncbi:MAG: hypothetical protein LBI28_03780 [Treponema sp.]|jgi:tetratricopeptide (TPR) repeat protein|nr:hypothetical protein [Treponema sp.]